MGFAEHVLCVFDMQSIEVRIPQELFWFETILPPVERERPGVMWPTINIENSGALFRADVGLFVVGKSCVLIWDPCPEGFPEILRVAYCNEWGPNALLYSGNSAVTLKTLSF